MTQWFSWPTMKQGFELFVRNCDVFQKFDNVIHIPATTLNFASSPWPFYKWGINIVGLLPLATRHRKFILVATDYFTKRAKAEAYAHIKATELVQFM